MGRVGAGWPSPTAPAGTQPVRYDIGIQSHLGAEDAKEPTVVELSAPGAEREGRGPRDPLSSSGSSLSAQNGL